MAYNQQKTGFFFSHFSFCTLKTTSVYCSDDKIHVSLEYGFSVEKIQCNPQLLTCSSSQKKQLELAYNKTVACSRQPCGMILPLFNEAHRQKFPLLLSLWGLEPDVV